MGRTQFATISDPGPVLWAQWRFGHQALLSRPWPGSKERLPNVFRTGLKLCGASSLQVKLGSLRPGGTTHLFINGTEVHGIKLAGRWANEQSLTHYIQEAMSYMVWGSLSVVQESDMRQIAEVSRFAWLKPPCAVVAPALVQTWRRTRQT